MRVGHVRLLRRSMIGIIFAVLLAVAYNYLQTWRRNARIITQAAQVLSPEMMRSADSIEYSTYENGRVRFKIRAERLLETRAGKSLLQGVEGSDRNPDGSVGNQIHSQRADYDADHKLADFSGNVQLDIGSEVRIRTDSLHYDLNTNTGSTDDNLQFYSKEAQGTARGVLYNQPQKTIELKGNLDFTMVRAVGGKKDSGQTERIRARSNRGYYSRDERLLRFQGNARLDSESASLSGESIEARFSEDQKHLASLTCEGNVAYEAKDAGVPRLLQGDRMLFEIDRETGSLSSIDVTGHAMFSSSSEEGDQELRGSTIRMELDPDGGQPRQILSQGGVQLNMKRDAEETTVTGEKLETAFVPGSGVLQAIHVREHARMVTNRGQNAGRDELTAEDVRLHFRTVQGRSALSELQAETSVQLNSTPPKSGVGGGGNGARSLSASRLTMTYAKSGDHFESGKATGNVILSGIPLGDAKRPEIRRLTADTVQFHFYPEDNRLRNFEGEGHVRVFYLKPEETATKTPPQEFRTSSTNIAASFKESDGSAQQVSQWGSFIYEDGIRTANAGRGDYDAEKDILFLRESPRVADESGTTSGNVIEYDRKQKTLTVHRDVQSILKARENSPTPFTNSSDSGSPSVVTADEMQYWTEEKRAHYFGNVQLLSENGQLQAGSLEVFNGGERVEAEGSVQHLIPGSQAGEQARPPSQKQARSGSSEKERRGEPVLIRSDRLRYNRTENSIHYLGTVRLISGDTDMSAENLDAILDKEGKQIERASARGRVEIHQAARLVRGDIAHYYLDPGKFVVQGTPAEIQDPASGKSTARRLTFSTSDDRILLDNRPAEAP